MRKFTIAITGLVLLSFLLSIYFYPQVPEQMATHWNSQGEVDGYMSKFWGLFFMPLVITSLAVMFLIIPRIDPKKENIEKFRKYYDGFIVILILFMIAVHLQILLWNAGVQISPNAILPVGIGLLFYYIGILTENAERNWFIGIRTPWTLSSDRVWKRTNRLGGKLFKIAGIVAVFGAFFPELAIYFILVPAIAIAGITVVYSYIEYQKELKESKERPEGHET
ncbi:membrane protein, putative [Methanosarcina horonobensis HB-1 = JCM 15518]|uniref:Membrane protein, putative n=1 Tax=Methanosarcina horonobensis HB-1 = JCM 15518 TaxID=1434110 RepID=A0A0E3SDN9_9EURY|nr:SdpI family protein [Methanosarcina horonobensis]AKB77593.1 membrane protein, putative [Methanosarcina horonobensis HB-1 = JCM 15518]